MQLIRRIKPFVPPAIRKKIYTVVSPQPDSAWQQQKLVEMWPSVHFKWNLRSVVEEGNCLNIAGWAIAPPEERARLVFTCDGEPCDEVQYPLPQPFANNTYSYIPYAVDRGYVCKVHLKPGDDSRRDGFTFRCIDRQTRQSPGGGDRPYYYVRRRPDEILPEPNRVLRVAGFSSPEFFYLQGYNLFRQLDDALHHTVGRGLAEFPQVLDWGCGCGRVALHFRRLPSVQLTGVDVDADNIEWCQKNLLFGHFQTIPLYPPMPLASESFDLIIGVSIFTHLREEVAFEWLAELRRVAKKGAILLISYHGNTALAINGTSLTSLQFHALLCNGFLDLPNEGYDAKLDETEYYRDVRHLNFYIKQHWSKYFEIVDLIPAGVGIQDVAVLRKR
jgi:SAM-dependent methyltransferase